MSVLIEYIFMVLVGFMIGVAFMMPSNSNLKKECEESLPRTQHCKMVYIPDEGKK